MSMVAQGKDEAFDRAVPSAAHYNDFREDLLRDPTSLPQKLRRTQFKWVTGRGFRKPDAHSHKRFGREIRLILRSVRKPITRCGWGSSKV